MLLQLLLCITFLSADPYSLVVKAARQGLHGSGIESRWRRHFSHPSRPALGPTYHFIQMSEVIFVFKLAMKAQKRNRVIVLRFLNLSTTWRWVVTHREETCYPLLRRLRGSQGRSGRVRETLPPLGFNHRTVQLVASRCALPAHPIQ